MPLLVCTSNAGKAAEIERMLQLEVKMVSIDLEEIQSLDPAIVSAHKAQQAFATFGQAVMVDDTALHLAALGGFPGALIAWVLKTGDSGLLHRMVPAGAGPSATAVTTIGYADRGGVRVFTGATFGAIIANPVGNNGFGFDPVFMPDGENRTFAQMSNAEKDALSPRRKALGSLQDYLIAQAAANQAAP